MRKIHDLTGEELLKIAYFIHDSLDQEDISGGDFIEETAAFIDTILTQPPQETQENDHED